MPNGGFMQASLAEGVSNRQLQPGTQDRYGAVLGSIRGVPDKNETWPIRRYMNFGRQRTTGIVHGLADHLHLRCNKMSQTQTKPIFPRVF
mmetsp:Transcript_39833/g.64649  ORF Transcript_39833/g.64649 Transcript_39833/m.64649 type:complete len:90 (-) Transcript_39833:100-369(-)